MLNPTNGDCAMHCGEAGTRLSRTIRQATPSAFVVVSPSCSRASIALSSLFICTGAPRDDALRAANLLRRRPFSRGRALMPAASNNSFPSKQSVIRSLQGTGLSNLRMCSEGNKPPRLDSLEGRDTGSTFASGFVAGDVVSDTGVALCEVELRNVTLRYGEKVILNDVSLKIHRGESLALLGPSGTGKSTILKLISGLSMPTSGEIIIRGITRMRTIKQEPPGRNQAKIAVVFQNPALFDSLTVGENVAFELLELSDLDDARISALAKVAIERVGLRQEVLDLYPPQLSGGMQKRVSFARAVTFDPDSPSGGICCAPDVLLLDEPTAGLDPVVSTRMEDLVRQLQQVCPTCVTVTHAFSTVRRTADRVVFLHDGKIRWDGAVSDIDTCTNPYVRQFFSASLNGPMQFQDDLVARDEELSAEDSVSPPSVEQ